MPPDVFVVAILRWWDYEWFLFIYKVLVILNKIIAYFYFLISLKRKYLGLLFLVRYLVWGERGPWKKSRQHHGTWAREWGCSGGGSCSHQDSCYERVGCKEHSQRKKSIENRGERKWGWTRNWQGAEVERLAQGERRGWLSDTEGKEGW